MAMTYLQEFRAQINSRNFSKFLQLWEEYCSSDQVDSDEFILFLQSVKNSEFAIPFGKLIETALPLWQTIQDKEASYQVLKLLIDVEVTNAPQLADLVLQTLKERYGQHPQFNERLRLIGLRARDNFQGALSKFELLTHMEKGKFVFHPGGWGAGEIVDVSQIRQQATIEFENVPGRKSLTFENAFKVLMPLRDDHFLAQRFAQPDELEKEARQDPVGVIKRLLRDLGPKSAGEIKDEMSGLVIPENEWPKWWQNARSRLKKDPLIESPDLLKEPFQLRKTEISQQDRLQAAIKHKTTADEIIQATYDFLRDLPTMRKHQEVLDSIREKLIALLSDPTLTPEQELQICICLETQFGHEIADKKTKDLILRLNNVEETIQHIDIIALKKRALVLVREWRKDWVQVFLNVLVSVKHSALRDYLLKELSQGEGKAQLEKFLNDLLQHPERHPDLLVWYFQKVVSQEGEVDKEEQCRCLESFLVLLSVVENKPEYRDLAKKMYMLLSGKRYAVVRAIMEGTSLEFIKEFLLLASKCQIFTDHDRKILHSLAAVVHPSIGKSDQDDSHAHTIWTSEAGYLKVQDQLKHIGTVEIVANAREVEAARALGDLRENSEYKFAVERRSRLQGQLKTLSEQFKRARILTKDDINPSEVSVGSVVDVVDEEGKKTVYTILGPWDADPENHVLSFQSKLAEAMIGCKKGDKFKFRDSQLKVAGIRSFFDV